MAVWLAIMAIVFILALAVWITLVFRADRREPGQAQEASPDREVIGGRFDAHAGGRQVMPDRREVAPEEESSRRGPRS